MTRTSVLLPLRHEKRPRVGLTTGGLDDTWIGGADMSDSTPRELWTDKAGRNFFDRFWSKVDADGDCWDWGGTRDDQNYGVFKFDGWSQYAHRVAYEHLVGAIPDGRVIDHLCRNTICVNPDHLQPVTHQTNTRRGFGLAGLNARKTHCKRGHAFTPENTIDHPRGRGCRQCARMMKQRRRDRARAEGRRPV